MSEQNQAEQFFDIAVVGMSGRFPGAKNLAAFWRNLRDGVDSIQRPSAEEIEAHGVSSALANNPSYVHASSTLDEIDQFDTEFFGFSPRDADILDPQHRIFLEICWEALEDAGYDPATYREKVGVFAGAAANSYLLGAVMQNPRVVGAVGSLQVLVSNQVDYFATRASYKLDLKGPSVNVQTTCSTSLVAIHLACQSLIDHHCSMALAGGVTIRIPQATGYLYEGAGIHSPNGYCRPFDADAQGTVFGEGAGVVVLRRLADAIADGDCIRAVIKGSAVNNDGSDKLDFAAPSVDGQADVIGEALGTAQIDPRSIGYVEAHGTGTTLGDPVEVAALDRAFRNYTADRSFCALGSVKSNVGHLEIAAGIAGVIKTVQALEHRMLPPSLHFRHPNPAIDFASTPFYVNDRLREWVRGDGPRRAGVNSFGIGGTNAHAILEEAPEIERNKRSRPQQLLLLSARGAASLDAATRNLSEFLAAHPEIDLPDAAYTLCVGRRAFGVRRAVVSENATTAVDALAKLDPRAVATSRVAPSERAVAFLFPGQGSQHPNMARDLHRHEPVFREELDRCCALVQAAVGLDLKELLVTEESSPEETAQRLRQTAVTQPALFAVEYALARLWMSWGIEPAAMIGHSVGEYVAACLAGVMSPEDAARLVAIRGELMQSLPAGAMLSVSLPEAGLREQIGSHLALAAINARNICTVSGPTDAIDKLEETLAGRDVTVRRLQTSHAFHSSMMDPIVDRFAAEVAGVKLRPPELAYVSNVTGTWAAHEVTDPRYWARHLRECVRFAEGLAELRRRFAPLLLEVGPGTALAVLAREQDPRPAADEVLNSLPHPRDPRPAQAQLLGALGRLWISGVEPSWQAFFAGQERRRVSLPTYPFERRRHWVEPQELDVAAIQQTLKRMARRPGDVSSWFYRAQWTRVGRLRGFDPEVLDASPGPWLLFRDAGGLCDEIATQLRSHGCRAVVADIGTTFLRRDEDAFEIDPASGADYARLIQEAAPAAGETLRVIHLWNADESPPAEGAETFGFMSLVTLTQALSQEKVRAPVRIAVVSSGLQDVTGDETLHPERATLLGPCRVIPQEFDNVRCRSVDVSPDSSSRAPSLVAAALVAECLGDPHGLCTAYRGSFRWMERYTPAGLQEPDDPAVGLRERGVYLVTGGLGDVGLALAEHLARHARARLALMGRSELPPRRDWDAWIQSHPEEDPTVKKLRGVRRLEELGAEVLTLSADVADADAVADALAEIRNRWGDLHGVIHAAGILGDRLLRSLPEMTPQHAGEQFRPKLAGLRVLDAALGEAQLDFLIAVSSLSSVLGGLGMTSYAAANAYLDAFAQASERRPGASWLSIDWDYWDFTHQGGGLGPEEGRRTLHFALAADAGNRLIVAVDELEPRVARWIEQWEDASPGGDAAEDAPQTARPEGAGAAVPARNETEKMLLSIWRDLLGIEEIGIHDDFFALGGHSLTAGHMSTRVREELDVAVPPGVIFEAPTPAEFALRIDELRSGAAPAETASAARASTPARSRRVPGAGGLELRVLEWGDAGPACVLLHGFGHEAHVWDDLAHELARDHRVFALDLRGHGDSARDPEGRYDGEVLRRDLESAVRHLDLREFALVGHSLGGEVAIGFAAEHPIRVPQLVLVESGPELCVAGVERIDADERSAARTYRSVEEYATVLTERYQFSSPQIASRLAAPALRRRPDGLYELKRDPSFELDPAKPQRGVTRRDGRMIHEGLWRALGRIRCPTLVLRGVVSSMLPRDVAQRMVDEVLARGELAEIPLAGHAVMLDNPTGLRDALTAFLRAHGS